MSLKKTHFEYITEVSQKNPNIEVIGIYNGNKEKILHKCKICGCEWEIKPIHVIHGHGCPQCAKIQRAKSKTMNHSEYEKRVLDLNPNIILMETFTGVHKSIKVKCKICGHEWSPMAYSLLEPHNCGGCKQCYILKRTKTTNQFVKELKQQNPYVKLIGEYVNSYTKALFKCYGCRQQCEWLTTPSIVLSGGKSPTCHSSNGEIRIMRFLQSNNIEFKKEYKFQDCKNINLLPFDFYLPKYNICIEYDGEQHYRPINFGGCSNEKAMKSFQSTCINDNIKNQYCVNHNINLLRIPYYDCKNIEQILFDYLQKYKEEYV